MKKEGKSRRGSAFRAIVIGGVLIAAAIVVLYTPWFRLLDLREVSVGGNRHVAAVEIVARSGLTRGQSVLAISPKRVAGRLLDHPWIKQAKVVRLLPHSIGIQIVEREEIAWVRDSAGEGCLILGEGGIVVAEARPSSPLIEVRGAKLTKEVFGGRLLDPRVNTLLNLLQGEFLQSLHIRSLDVFDPTSIELVTEDDLRIWLGGLDSAPDRMTALVALCRTIDVRAYELIDLRFGGEATLVPRKAVRR